VTATIGTPVSRVDGPAKVTGRAPYAAEFAPPGLAYAAIVESAIPAGRITAIDTAAAERAPGVILVLTHYNAPTLPYQPAKERPAVEPVSGDQLRVLQDADVTFSGQPIGLVVAETQAQADDAASLVRVTYDRDPALLTRFDPARSRPTSEAAAGGGRRPPAPPGAPPRAAAAPRRGRATPTARSPPPRFAWRGPTCNRASTTTPWSRTRRWRSGRATT